MTDEEQYEAFTQWRHDRQDEREEEIRKLAVQAAEFDPALGPIRLAWSDPGALIPYLSDDLVPPASVRWQEIAVRIHPCITGFARVLIAEEIIRRQLGDVV